MVLKLTSVFILLVVSNLLVPCSYLTYQSIPQTEYGGQEEESHQRGTTAKLVDYEGDRPTGYLEEENVVFRWVEILVLVNIDLRTGPSQVGGGDAVAQVGGVLHVPVVGHEAHHADNNHQWEQISDLTYHTIVMAIVNFFNLLYLNSSRKFFCCSSSGF